MPYDLALNIDNTDLHKLKMDSPLKMEEIDGNFYLTALAMAPWLILRIIYMPPVPWPSGMGI